MLPHCARAKKFTLSKFQGTGLKTTLINCDCNQKTMKINENTLMAFSTSKDVPVVKEGWLWKQGGRYKSWKRRWFILNDNCLYYFEFTTDKEPRGIIPLENIQVRPLTL